MSMTVEMSSLANIITRYRFAYLMTTSAQGAPHAVAVTAVLQGSELVVLGIGRRSRENALARSAVGLIWPPQAEGDYSLIIDGQAVVTGDSLQIAPTRAVLHRPAPSPAPQVSGTCGSDCVELPLRS
jgi:hypothetical protein